MNQLVATDMFLLMIDGMKQFTVTDLDFLREQVRLSVPRIAGLGGWPVYIDGERSLVSRVPTMLDTAPGFDAGIACALNMIPAEKQTLSATLHAAYTEAAVEQVRSEFYLGLGSEASIKMDAESETCWWLAACSICKEGGIDNESFARQLHAFRALAQNPPMRIAAAYDTLLSMRKNFTLVDGIPFVIRDGGLQGAYISGYDWGVQYNEVYGIFFIGTFRPSLGLENFPFSDRKDAEGRPMSGPVHGSRQFVKASSFKELEAATRFVREHLGPPKK
ncbi:hypothetical protein IPH19_02950 [Candidatus Uhrbacteria bacterium]|nr:MAG: hypothetical protein IPH19_02950 [Candidatus Uhrbacteria bacterium]